MRCHRARVLIIQGQRQALSTGDREALSHHLDGCTSCRDEARQLASTAGLLTAITLPTTPVTAGRRPTAAALLERARMDEVRPRRGAPARWALGLAGLAVLGAVVGREVGRPVGALHGDPRGARTVTPDGAATGPAPATAPPASVASPPAASVSSPGAGSPAERVGNRHAVASAALARRAHLRLTASAPGLAASTDATYLDGRDPALAARWLGSSAQDNEMRRWLRRTLPPVCDDFVRVPLPQLAAADPKSPAVGEAIRKYEQDAKVVDPRLFRKVTLHEKGSSLAELCEALEQQVGVRLRASRGVQDEKVTVFVEELPAREVMREVARLYGFFWARSGEEGHYHYELVQDLKSQLTEQEMRDRDIHLALVALDAQMAKLESLLGLTPEQVRARAEQASGAERSLLTEVAGAGWGGMQLYHRLTATERLGLLNGAPVRFRASEANANRRLPAELEGPLAALIGSTRLAPPGSPAGSPTVSGLEVSLQVNRSELGQLSLEAETRGMSTDGQSSHYLGFPSHLATASSPSVEKPDNARRNAALKNEARYQRGVALRPAPSCPRLAAAEAARKRGEALPSLQEELLRHAESGLALTPERYHRLQELTAPHVSSADVWEAVHQQSGLPVVADYYSHAYPAAALTLQGPLFDVLCRVGEGLRVRWSQDGGFLLGRSTSFFWDRLKEVPNRQLRRWAEDHKHGLPAEELLEMAQLSDEQLDSEIVGGVVTHCWELPEWDLMQKPGGFLSARPWLRLLGSLPPEQSRKASDLPGLPVSTLTPDAQRTVRGLMEHFPVDSWPAGRIRLDYAAAGSYVWAPTLAGHPSPSEMDRLPLISAPTSDEVLRKARQLEPGVGPDEILKTDGVLYVTMELPGGTLLRVAGERPIRIRILPPGGS